MQIESWFDEQGQPLQIWQSRKPVMLRVDNDTLVTANRVQLEVVMGTDPPQVRLTAWMDRAQVYRMSLASPHPALTEEALLKWSPHRPVELELHATTVVRRALAIALEEGTPLEACVTRTSDGGFPVFFDLMHYQLAAVRQGAQADEQVAANR